KPNPLQSLDDALHTVSTDLKKGVKKINSYCNSMELHNLKDDDLKNRETIAKTFSFETATFYKMPNQEF
ncbi:hypothetical protein KEJ15_01130, partial [Candidatus Bathyarchaeota archaeon]|nr:hypothetical protein [Candidatus Bathyarchaeota archaeon]